MYTPTHQCTAHILVCTALHFGRGLMPTPFPSIPTRQICLDSQSVELSVAFKMLHGRMPHCVLVTLILPLWSDCHSNAFVYEYVAMLVFAQVISKGNIFKSSFTVDLCTRMCVFVWGTEYTVPTTNVNSNSESVCHTLSVATRYICHGLL